LTTAIVSDFLPVENNKKQKQNKNRIHIGREKLIERNLFLMPSRQGRIRRNRNLTLLLPDLLL
jgi:hypothetical protein